MGTKGRYSPDVFFKINYIAVPDQMTNWSGVSSFTQRGRMKNPRITCRSFWNWLNATKRVFAKFKISILDAEGEKKITKGRSVIHFTIKHFLFQFVLQDIRRSADLHKEPDCWGFPKFIRRDLLDKRNLFLPHDRLSIFIEVTMVEADMFNFSFISFYSMTFHLPTRRLLDMGGIFEGNLFANCVLSSNDKEFQVPNT